MACLCWKPDSCLQGILNGALGKHAYITRCWGVGRRPHSTLVLLNGVDKLDPIFSLVKQRSQNSFCLSIPMQQWFRTPFQIWNDDFTPLTRLTNLKNIYLFCVCSYGDQRTACRSQSSLPSMWPAKLGPRLSGNTSIPGAISQVLSCHSTCFQSPTFLSLL